MEHRDQLDTEFRSLTGHPPYPWQRALYGELVAGRFPADINLPTGAGKTAIMAIWLAALAWRARNATAADFPRRLVWVVDRRVVVDQATEQAVAMRKALGAESETAQELRKALALLSGDPSTAFAISTLRGECEDNEEWLDPSRPAIIVGTVDMVGSRLLFSGYGDGPYRAAQHAGLLGQDSLIVNDEAHLTPAFALLLQRLENFHTHSPKPFHTIRLSATHPGASCWPMSLTEDEADPLFARTYHATKHLHLELPRERLFDIACSSHRPARILIYVEKPETAAACASHIGHRTSKPDRIRILTGTMRGAERDQLTEDPVYLAFAAKEPPTESCWLVSTSAGEVGADISSDILITESSELDHLLQRFGRSNRFGETDAHIYVIEDDSPTRGDKERKDRCAAARTTLASLPHLDDGSYDASPAALFGRALPTEACTPQPRFQQLYGWQIENLSQTSLRSHPARPPVAGWLHGQQEHVPEAFLAWRSDVAYLASDGADPGDLEALLQRHRRVLGHERLRMRADHMLEALRFLASQTPTTPWLLQKPDGTVATGKLAELPAKPSGIANCQILLPPGCGRLEHGMFVPEPPPADELYPYDLAPGTCMLATVQDEGFWQLIPLAPTSPGAQEIPDLNLPTLRRFAVARGMRFTFAIVLGRTDSEDPAPRLLYFQPAMAVQTANAVPYLLEHHLRDVAATAAALGRRCGLRPEIVSAIEIAGALHDRGKAAPIWQHYAGRLSGPAVAKCIRAQHWSALGGYRHELGSLLAAASEELPTAERELILHLVAAHHRSARPHFTAHASDRRNLQASRQAIAATPARFAALQQHYEPWGLAYLESLLRSADVQCAEPQEAPKPAREATGA